MNSTVTIAGNLTRDPELRYTASGVPVANFTVVYNKRTKNDDGKWEDGDAQFFDVSCWRELAVNVSESLEKGQRVLVSGRLEQQQWETKEGEGRSKVQVVADEVGPSLRWATADVVKVGRSERSVSDEDVETVKAAFDEEPF